MLTVHARVHTAEAILTKDGVDGLNACLWWGDRERKNKIVIFASSEDVALPLYL